MKNLLYHRVQNKLIDQVLSSNSIKSHQDIEGNQICMTRDVIFMSTSRPFVVVFDRDKLRKHFKVKPFCLLGWKFVNKTKDFDRWNKIFTYGFEKEERVFAKEIPLELAEYYGILKSGCFDYKKPTKVHSHRFFDGYLDEVRENQLKTIRKEIRKVFTEGNNND